MYCHNMKSDPVEYLTINPENNVAHYDSRRYKNTTECGGEFNQNYSSYSAGHAVFSKVRIMLDLLQIAQNDYTFSTTTSGLRIPYAWAADCHGTGACPLGYFKVDLTGTCARVRPDQVWWSWGHPGRTMELEFNPERTVVTGRCGGSCGGCHPGIGQSFGVHVEPTEHCQ